MLSKSTPKVSSVGKQPFEQSGRKYEKILLVSVFVFKYVSQKYEKKVQKYTHFQKYDFWFVFDQLTVLFLRCCDRKSVLVA